MKTISPSLMRAGKSLGGTPLVSFVKIYFPLTIPGIVNGKYIFTNDTSGVPPKDFPARIKLGEIVFITLYKGKTINGKSICVIATKVPITLYINSGLLSSAAKPIQTIKSFIGPCC